MDEPLTVQKQRDRHAQDIVTALAEQKATGEQALQLLEDTCHDDSQLHFAPHLVTAMREAGWQHMLDRARLNRTQEAA